jgi:hypothetical protein
MFDPAPEVTTDEPVCYCEVCDEPFSGERPGDLYELESGPVAAHADHVAAN